LTDCSAFIIDVYNRFGDQVASISL